MEGGRTSPLGALGHGVSIAHGPPQSITHDHIKQGARERIGGRKMKLNFIQQGEQLKRETEISKNLQLFKKRDLGKANQWRLSSGAGDGGALQAATLPAAAGDFGSPARRRRDDAASDSPTNTSIADSQPTLHQGKFGARSRLFGADKANREGEFATQGPSILFHTTCMDGLESMRAKTLPGAPHTNPSSVVPLGMSTTLTLPDATGNTSAVANTTAADVPDNMSIGGMSARSGPPPSNAATAASQQQELAKVYRNVEKIWVERRAREVEDRLEEMEFKDTVNMWNYEQARLEEESNRRQESYQMSSQTGKQCHRILYRPSTAPTQKVAPAPPVMVNEAGLLERPISQQEKHRTQMAFGGETRKPHPPGTSPSGAFLTEAPLSPATGASPPAGQEGGFASTAAQLLGGAMPGVSLSPYENYDPCTEKSDMRLLHKEERRGLDALTVGDEPEVDLEIDTDALAAGRPAGGQSRGMAARLGAIQGLQATGPKGLTHTHPEALVSTSLINAELDVVPDRTTVFAPSQAAAISRGKKEPEKKPAAEEPKGKAGSRPSTRGSSRPTSSARPVGKKGKAPRKPVDPNCIDQLFPPMSIAEQVPSLVRTQQMQQIEAVREAFAKHGISMPTSVLEGGLLTPQDQPYQSCLNDLPGPDMGFVPDWTKQTSKGKKKKKGGKKKKKRG